jgi:predicted permease
MLTDLLVRLRALFRRDAVEHELEDEIRFHLQRQAEKYVKSGLSRDEAVRRAMLAFGGSDRSKEACRDARGVAFVEQTLQDLRYAARVLRKRPGFTIIALLSLALGIGATTAVFTVLDAVVLRSLPVRDPDRLVIVRAERRAERFVLFNPVYEDLRRRQTVLSGLAAISDEPYLKVTLGPSTPPAYIESSLVSGNYFRVLGLHPAIGRLLTDSDDEPSAGCAAIISHGLWERQFQQSPDVLGRRVRVRDTECTIVGVTPASFRGHQAGFTSDLWLPLRPLTDRALLSNHHMAFFSGVIGRLKNQVTHAQAQTELSALYQQIEATEPQEPRPGEPRLLPSDFGIRLLPGAQGLGALRETFDQPLWIIFSIVVVFLLIATANVGTLLLARGEARATELATRAALGGSRGRLLRQLVAEGALLSLVGGAAGIVVAWAVTPALASVISMPYFTVSLETGVTLRVALAVAGVVVFATLVTGLMPAWRLSHVDLQPSIAGGRTTSASGRRLARKLIAAQIALSLLLVFSAGLLLRTMAHLYAIHPGFEPDHVVVFEVHLERSGASSRYGTPRDEQDGLASEYESLEQELNAIPGVRSAGLSWLELLGGSDLWLTVTEPTRPGDRREARIDYVSARYFETVGMQIVRGRAFTAADVRGSRPVIVVNETLARQRFGGVDPLGRLLTLEYPRDQQPPFTIVGIVKDSKYNDIREAKAEPMVWVPIAQWPQAIQAIALRTQAGTDADVIRRTRSALRAQDPDLMIRRVTTLRAQVDDTMARERLLLNLASGFSALALFLAAVGLYGMMAYAVARRTRELGIRVALGAARRNVVGMIMRDAFALVTFGALVGVPLALAAGFACRSFLFGVDPSDVGTLVVSCALLAAVAALAAYAPARRASRIEPMAALRHE